LAGTLIGDTQAERRAEFDQLRRQLADAALCGANTVVLTARNLQTSVLEAYFTDVCQVLAQRAEDQGMHLAVLARPGTCLPDAKRAIAWLAEPGRERIGLALEEEGLRWIGQAGNRLFYVRLRGFEPNGNWRDALLAIGYRGMIGVVPPTFFSTADQSPQTSSRTSSAT
jgi:sugar phosphate isomerase/epimerase